MYIAKCVMAIFCASGAGAMDDATPPPTPMTADVKAFPLRTPRTADAKAFPAICGVADGESGDGSSSTSGDSAGLLSQNASGSAFSNSSGEGGSDLPLMLSADETKAATKAVQLQWQTRVEITSRNRRGGPMIIRGVHVAEDSDMLRNIIVEKMAQGEEPATLTQLIKTARSATQIEVLRPLLTYPSIIDVDMQKALVRYMIKDPRKPGIAQGVLFFLIREQDSFTPECRPHEMFKGDRRVLRLFEAWSRYTGVRADRSKLGAGIRSEATLDVPENQTRRVRRRRKRSTTSTHRRRRHRSREGDARIRGRASKNLHRKKRG